MRLTLITAAIMLVSVQANASIEQQLTQCAATADKLDRLICYDKLAESLKGMTPNTISTQAIPATVATVAVPTTAAAIVATAPKHQRQKLPMTLGWKPSVFKKILSIRFI